MTPASACTKQWRARFRARDPEGYNAYRREEYRKNRLKPGVLKKNRDLMWKSTLKRVYGITEADWHRMFEEQGRVCALCKKPFAEDERPAVDHNHMTGKVRGLVHRKRCNFIIGWVENHGTLWVSTIDYLKRLG